MRTTATSLAPLTTFGIGGPAEVLWTASDVPELRAALLWAREHDKPVCLLGGGSNVLVADQGFAGVVIRYVGAGIAPTRDAAGRTLWCAQAGTLWTDLVDAAVAQGLFGIEGLAGIPGHVGAAPVQNIGAYGQELKDVLQIVSVIDRNSLDSFEIPAAECGLGYRTSLFKTRWRERYVITAVTIALSTEAAPATHPELARRLGLGPGQAAATPAVLREHVLTLRREKSMLFDVTDANSRGAGSFFTNPVVDSAHADAIAARATAASLPALPRYPAGAGRTKLPAAWLIEHAGFGKGYGSGRAGLSERHVLAIVNRGGATADDVVALAALIVRGVRQAFGITLEPEPVFVGFAADGPAVLAARANA